jgi:hypothetical protein
MLQRCTQRRVHHDTSLLKIITLARAVKSGNNSLTTTDTTACFNMFAGASLCHVCSEEPNN